MPDTTEKGQITMSNEIDIICGQTHTGTTCTRQHGHTGPHAGTDNWDQRFVWDAN